MAGGGPEQFTEGGGDARAEGEQICRNLISKSLHGVDQDLHAC